MNPQTQQLLQELGRLDEDDKKFVDEPCLQRYIDACFGDVKAAAGQLKQTLEWRKTFKPDTTLTDDLAQCILKEKHYFSGVASNGVPVLVTRKRTRRLLPQEEDGYIRFLVYTSEKAIAAMKDDVEQWVWILDLKGYTSGNSPRLSMVRKTIKLVADHYPERLKKGYIVDAPTVFYVLYKVVYPFLDKVTQQKVSFVYSANYDSDGNRVDGSQEDDTEFSTYYPLYAKHHDPETYLSTLQELESARDT